MITKKTNVHLNNNNKKKLRCVKNLDIAKFLFHVKVNIHRIVTVRNLRHCHNIMVFLPLANYAHD